MSTAHSAGDEHDAELARVLGELEAQHCAGQVPDFDALERSHPELAGEARELWEMARLLEQTAPTDSAAPAEHGSPAPLPRTFGNYRLVRELGRGGMGVVYEAEQPSLGRTVALKTVLRGEHASAQDLARLRAEAEAAARLVHPGILPVHEIDEHDGQLFFTMQIATGGTLAQRLAHGPLPQREAAELLATIARAVQHAHEHGILHRDLKPSNILLSDEGRAYVADFGLARRLRAGGGLTASQTLLGTPSYMAPEQAAGQRGRLSAATDVWGLGAVLYHALTGRPPFVGATPLEIVMDVREQDPPPPRLLDPRIDRDLEMIVAKCLQKPPELRYSSAAELAGDLEAWLAHEPIAARAGRFRDVLARALRPTHNAPVLENWGGLWMFHGGVVLALCVLTWFLQQRGVDSRWPYLAVWGAGFGGWALVFWLLRRRAGPVTFVERQLAHIWGNSVFCCFVLLLVEWILGLRVLTLSPVIALFSGGVFLMKASLLSGRFYFAAGALYVTALPMALWPQWALLLFGLMGGGTFFVPGLAAYRRRHAIAPPPARR